MDFKIKLNGADVTKKIAFSSCNLYDRLGGMLDNVKIVFPYESGVTINKFDKLEVTADKYKTGVMYVTGCGGANNNTSCSITAVSGKPTNRNKRTRLIANVTLYQLIDDVAKSCGLGIKLYGVINYTYESVCQRDETDLQFLNRICQREGYSVKVDDGNIVIFNDYALENNYEPAKLNKSDVSSFDFKRAENGLRSMTVKFYSIKDHKMIQFTTTDESFEGGAESKIECMSTINEAERFSKGYLRAINNMALTGTLSMEFNTDLSAGTTVDLTGFDEYDGRYIIYELRHDISSAKTYLKIRKTLDY